MKCYKPSSGCGVYEMRSCNECPYSKPRELSKPENLTSACADDKFSNMQNREIYVTERVINAFIESKEKVKGFKEYSYMDTVKNYAHFVFLDSSDIYERCSDEPFYKALIDTCMDADKFNLCK